MSCENLLGESSELFGSVPEGALKSGKSSTRKMYRSGGGIFSNPFRSDSEKMEQLTELLKQYRENSIPDPKHLPVLSAPSKLNHLRASSLSISGVLGSGLQTSQPPSLLSTNKTSLSTTDLHHLNHSSVGLMPFSDHATDDPVLSGTSFESKFYLEPEWRSIVQNADQLPGRVQSQNEAIWELLQTELFYIRRLKVINDIFIACLLNLQNECLLTEVSVCKSHTRSL